MQGSLSGLPCFLLKTGDIGRNKMPLSHWEPTGCFAKGQVNQLKNYLNWGEVTHDAVEI